MSCTSLLTESHIVEFRVTTRAAMNLSVQSGALWTVCSLRLLKYLRFDLLRHFLVHYTRLCYVIHSFYGRAYFFGCSRFIRPRKYSTVVNPNIGQQHPTLMLLPRFINDCSGSSSNDYGLSRLPIHQLCWLCDSTLLFIILKLFDIRIQDDLDFWSPFEDFL